MSATVDHVANLAGVSKATVSRVLNQRGNVHPDTVKLVRAAMLRARYQARAVRVGRGASAAGLAERGVAMSVYALVVPEITSGLCLTLLRGFGDAASERYHQPIVSNTGDNLYKQGDEILQLIHKRVGGVAILPVGSAETPAVHVQAIQSAGIPVVLLHRDVPGTTAPLVALPVERIGYRAGQVLLDHGHVHVALFTTPQGPSSNLHRSGLRKAMTERGLSPGDDAVYACEGAAPFSLPTLEAAVDRAMARIAALPEKQRPTAIYATNDIIAEVVYMRLMRDGVRLPNDMSLVSFGAQQRVGAIAPRVSSIVVDEWLIGAKAIELLERERARGAASDEPRLVENISISMAEGETLGRARG